MIALNNPKFIDEEMMFTRFEPEFILTCSSYQFVTYFGFIKIPFLYIEELRPERNEAV